MYFFLFDANNKEASFKRLLFESPNSDLGEYFHSCKSEHLPNPQIHIHLLSEILNEQDFCLLNEDSITSLCRNEQHIKGFAFKNGYAFQ